MSRTVPVQVRRAPPGSGGRRASPAGGRRRPCPASSRPAMTLIRVDLPAPLRPSRHTRSPGSTWKLTLSRIAGPPKAEVDVEKAEKRHERPKRGQATRRLQPRSGQMLRAGRPAYCDHGREPYRRAIDCNRTMGPTNGMPIVDQPQDLLPIQEPEIDSAPKRAAGRGSRSDGGRPRAGKDRPDAVDPDRARDDRLPLFRPARSSSLCSSRSSPRWR